MSLLKYFSYKAKNKGSSSSSPLSLSVSLPTRVPSLSSRELEVTNGFVDKAVTATIVSTASRGKYYQSIYPVERAAIGKYTVENGPGPTKYKPAWHF